MSGLIKSLQDRTTVTDERPRVIEMTDPDADEVLDTLGAETRRKTFRALFEEPKTPSELADQLDTSLQNVDYHLSSLKETGLVEQIDTVYSEKGNEMAVYGPANDPLVFVGDHRRTAPLKRTLQDVVAGLGLLAGASLLVQWGTELLIRSRLTSPGAAGAAGRESVSFPDGTVGWMIFDVIEPGVLFFTVALVFAAIVAISMHRRGQ